MNNEPSNKDILEAINTFATAVDMRFDEIDKRFEGNDQRFDGMDQRFDGMDQRFDGMDQRFDGMDQRFDKLELAVFNNTELIKGLDGRVIHLEEQHDRTFRRIDDFLVNMNRSSQEITSLRATSDRHEDKISTIEKKLSTV
ncbi:hypothetical protein GF391_02890 [Candidatus Uhrbacteria bacterium]|nr:hypothetical protein [Candidatus Uhrbacteria bacterium]